jgi:hypothetical protein
MVMRGEQRTRGLPDVAGPPPSDEVVVWRRQRLLSAGFDEVTARRLAAQTTVDLHAVLNLVDRGCPPSLAARIMDSRTGTRG